MSGLLAAGAAIVGAWALLLGTAVLARFQLRLRSSEAGALVLGAYASLAAASILVLGRGWQGFAGAGGMLLPVAIALLIVGRR